MAELTGTTKRGVAEIGRAALGEWLAPSDGRYVARTNPMPTLTQPSFAI
jgi:hypothetical protein